MVHRRCYAAAAAIVITQMTGGPLAAQIRDANSARGPARETRAPAVMPAQPPELPSVVLCPEYYRDAGGPNGSVLTPSIRYLGTSVGVVIGRPLYIELCEKTQASKALGAQSCQPPAGLTVNRVFRGQNDLTPNWNIEYLADPPLIAMPANKDYVLIWRLNPNTQASGWSSPFSFLAAAPKQLCRR